MSVDKERILPSEHPGDSSLSPPLQQLTDPFGKCTGNPQEHWENSTTKHEGTHSFADQGSEEPAEPEQPSEHGNMANQAGLDSSTQSQNGLQQPKSHQRLNKRRSTMNSSFKQPVFGKRRRRANSESESVLPTNFLLGGNIFDPLNLNSMLDEEVNRVLNAETPKSSPLPAKNRDPVEILIPRDITDPLNLNCSMAGDGGLLLSPLKSGGGGRRRHRNRHHGVIGVAGSGKGGEGGTVPQLGDLSEAEKGQTSPVSQKELQTGLPFASSGPHLDCVAAEPLIEEVLQSNSVLTQRAQCPGAPNTSSAVGGDAKEEMPTSAPVLETSRPAPSTIIAPTAPASHRQRKRKRTSSKSENFAGPYFDKNKGTSSSGSGSGRQPQGNHNQRTGVQPAQQQHLNQKKHQKNQQKPNHHQQHQTKKKFQYGNYDKYYGYRNPGLTEDPRMRTLKPEWFHGKDVLDLGCNTGRLTLSIAMNWQPSRIVGLDIDGSLIHAAKKNILYFLSEMHVLKARSGRKNDNRDTVEKPENMVEEPVTTKDEGERNKSEASLEKTVQSGGLVEIEEGKEVQEGEKEGEEVKMVMEEELEPEPAEQMVDRSVDGDEGEAEEGDAKKTDEGEAVLASSNGNCVFPVSLRISRGPIAAPPLPDTHPPSPGNFPANVSFVRGNYVLDSDMLLVTQREEFDVILCLSVTKWVHLNWGDAGLKRLFHRVYRHLRPGGLFVLEPQPWHSYSKRKKLTETITKNYYSICLKPEQFSTYLTSEVGFSSYELIGTPSNISRGFQRPIYLFHKGSTQKK